MKRLALAAAAAAIMSAALAAPASAATFDGECRVTGTAYFELPLTPIPTNQRWRFEMAGTCTGIYNGAPLVEGPITVKGQGRIDGSCGILTYGFGLNATATFPPSPSAEDNELDFRIDVVSAAFQNTLRLAGKHGGEAAGRASIVGVEDPAAELLACAQGNGSQVFGLSAQVAAARLSG